MTENGCLNRVEWAIRVPALRACLCCFLSLFGGFELQIFAQSNSKPSDLPPGIAPSQVNPQAPIAIPFHRLSEGQQLPVEQQHLLDLMEQESVLQLKFGDEHYQLQAVRARIKAVQEFIALKKTDQGNSPPAAVADRANTTSAKPLVVAPPIASEPRAKPDLPVPYPIDPPRPSALLEVAPLLTEPRAEKIGPKQEPSNNQPVAIPSDIATSANPSSSNQASEEESDVVRLLAAKVREEPSSHSEQEEESIAAFLLSDVDWESLPLIPIAAVVVCLVLTLAVAHFLFYFGSKLVFLCRRQNAKTAISPLSSRPEPAVIPEPTPIIPEPTPIFAAPVSTPLEPETLAASELPADLPINGVGISPAEENTPNLPEEPVAVQTSQVETRGTHTPSQHNKEALLQRLFEQNLHWRMQMGVSPRNP